MVARSNSAKPPSIWTIIRPRGGRRVEGLDRQAEGDAGGVEVFEELGQAPDRAGETVDPVDDQVIEATCPGLGQRANAGRSWVWPRET